ncbi:TadE/TadG family type IV pilus assembly protein [uncultured Arthrobacter sp.]|uniref:TadE/TadG family type IV pilus assembly protein n=1 Tax=uncultured Arthrobacter sp. TaxID=114050 RepID=UPI0028D1B6B5|nr:TadE/TadG family type IV pilus assembly protein [uncultured Arthrobacter sp.]
MRRASERGAVGVEFALLAPVLIMLLLGIMEFSRAYNVQTTLTNAAREGARAMAINNNATVALTATTNAGGALNPKLSDSNLTFAFQTIPQTTPAPTSCTPGSQVTLTVTYSLSTMTGIAGPFAMTGKGTMLCGG